MTRGTIAGLAVLLAVVTAQAGTVVFTPSGSTTVPVGTQIDFSVEIQAANDFEQAAVLIGAGDVTDLGFGTDTDWDLAFQSGFSSLSFDEPAPPAYSQNIFVLGDTEGSAAAGPNLVVGMLSVITTGMSPGTYNVSVKSDGDSYTFTPGEDQNPIPLTGSLEYTLTPEPGTLAVLALGGLLLRRRR